MTITNDIDKLIYEKEIRPYLPARIFDAHTHLAQWHRHPGFGLAPGTPQDDISMSVLRLWWDELFPHAAANGLVMGFPSAQVDVDAENAFVVEQVTDRCNRFSIMVKPDMSVQQVQADIERCRPFGLKPYLCFAQGVDPQQAEITDFLPEAQIALAHELGLAVTIHVSKPRGMADQGNLDAITRLVHAYPRCQFILAHCGRCFISVNMEDTLEQLPVAENLWIDTSAVCDMGVFMHLFSRYDRSRICFGTDLVTAAGFRGQYVRMGMSWDMVTAEQVARPRGQKIRATLCAYENLRSLLSAAHFCQMDEHDLQRLFYGNAAQLFRLQPDDAAD